MICSTPQQRDSTTASVTEPRANVAVSNDITAVGPMFTSFDVPSSTYMKQPMYAEYKPYCNNTVIEPTVYHTTRTHTHSV